jgi:hypothetical protein
MLAFWKADTMMTEDVFWDVTPCSLVYNYQHSKAKMKAAHSSEALVTITRLHAITLPPPEPQISHEHNLTALELNTNAHFQKVLFS